MKKLSSKQWIAVVVSLVVVVLFLTLGDTITSLFSGGENVAMTNNSIIGNQANVSVPGLVIEDIVVGTGDVAVAGKLVTTHYKGMLQDGRVFDTSIGRQPFTFPLGQGLVIQGWEKGIEGMRVGGKRRLTISPELGYGTVDMKDGAGNVVIPGNSTLVFEVELLEVK